MRYTRHNVILDIINEYEIETQDSLAAMLRERGLMLRRLPYQETSKNFSLLKF